MILQSERQWCSNCKCEINACHPQSLPFTEYGLNTFMMIMILRFKSLLTQKILQMFIHQSRALSF